MHIPLSFISSELLILATKYVRTFGMVEQINFISTKNMTNRGRIVTSFFMKQKTNQLTHPWWLGGRGVD